MQRHLLLALAALLITAFAGLMLTKALPYYTFEKDIYFLTTKRDAHINPKYTPASWNNLRKNNKWLAEKPIARR